MSCEFLGYLQNGLLFVSCFIFGFTAVGMYRTWRRHRLLDEKIKRGHARLQLIDDAMAKSGAMNQWVGLHTWRDLDPASREMFRHAITNALEEMDRSPPPLRN